MNKDNNDKFVIQLSTGTITIICKEPLKQCRLISTFRPMPTVTKVTETPKDEDVFMVNIKPQGAEEQIVKMTPAISVLAENVCKQCWIQRQKQKH